MTNETVARRSSTCLTWCQPADVDEPDIIVVDGKPLDVTDETARTLAVSRINHAAAAGTRAPVPSGGWKAVSSEGLVMDIPVTSSDPGVLPSVAVLVVSAQAVDTEIVVSQILQTAELAGYAAVAADVRRTLEMDVPRPKGLLARILAWLRGLFQRS